MCMNMTSITWHDMTKARPACCDNNLVTICFHCILLVPAVQADEAQLSRALTEMRMVVLKVLATVVPLALYLVRACTSQHVLLCLFDMQSFENLQRVQCVEQQPCHCM